MWAAVVGRPERLIDRAAVVSTQDNFIPHGGLVLWLKWPNSQVAVLMWSDGRGGVYTASCLCMHCGLLRPSPLDVRVMACLCTLIRRTCTDTPTVKRHQNQTPGQRHTHTHTQTVSRIDAAAVIIHRVGVVGGGQSHDVSCATCVRGNYVCNKFHKPSIPARTASSGSAFYMRFASNLLFICTNKRFSAATSRPLFSVCRPLLSPLLCNLGLTHPIMGPTLTVKDFSALVGARYRLPTHLRWGNI